MPKNKGKKKKDKKNRRVDDFFGGSDRTGMPRGSDYTVRVNSIGFPDRYRCYLKYVQSNSFNASPTPAAQVFRSSLFDPDNTGTGHQPTFYDQLSAVYARYCVLGMKAIVEVNNNSTTVPIFGAVAMCDSDISTLSVEALCEWKYVKKMNVGTASGQGSKTYTLPFVSTAKITGQPSVETDANMYSVTSANPSDPWFVIVKVSSDDGVSNVNGYVRTTIIFDCIFKELASPGESLSEPPSVVLKRLQNEKRLKALTAK